MNITVHLMMMGWLPVSMAMFLLLPPRRAIIGCYIFAVLFLPNHVYELRGLPDYSRETAASFGILLGVLLFDWRTVFNTFKPCIFDLPIVIYCLTPICTSMSDDLTLYDGISWSAEQVLTWGVPYFLGRVYLTNLDAFRDLAIGIVIGGLLYVPLCLYEVRMSPQLHRMFYGYHQSNFLQTKRGGGGFRPMVFMSHGLMLGMWMTAASLCAFWLWRTKAVKAIAGVPMILIVGVIMATTLLCKSSLSLMLLMMGLGLFYTMKFIKNPAPMFALLLVPPTYMYLRATGTWDGQELIDFAYRYYNEYRAQSIFTRIFNETQIAERAMERPWFGWGGYGRYFPNRGTIPDGFWIITLGKYGLVGLATWTLTMLTPVFLFLIGYPVRMWNHPRVAPAALLAMIGALFTADSLMNSMPNPIYVLGTGGLVSVAILMLTPAMHGRGFLQTLGWRLSAKLLRNYRSRQF